MTDHAAFFKGVRGELFSRLTQAQVDGMEAILAVTERRGMSTPQAAYCLATAYHETAQTMEPITERGGDAYLSKYDTGPLAARLGNTPEADGDGQLYCGRGFVQLTGLANYTKATAKLLATGVLKPGETLVLRPDYALRLDVAAAIMADGMLEGWFTGRSLKTLSPRATAADYVEARRIINGTDCAAKISAYAISFAKALRSAGWPQ